MSLFSSKRAGAFPDPIVPPFPGMPLMSGAANTNESAMRIGAVWACVRLLAESVSMMPLQAFNMSPTGQRVPLSAPPQLLIRPDPMLTLADWVYQVMASLLLNGNCYGRVFSRDGFAYPTGIRILNPETVQMKPDPQTGVWEYWVNGKREANQADIWHIPAFLMPGSPLGLSPIKYAAVTTATLSAVEAFAHGFFRDGAHPSSILSTEQSVTQEQARIVKDRVLAAVNGREPAVVGNGVKWNQIQVSPEESQFLETQKFGIAQIARIYGVPPEMVGGHAENGMTYANVTQRSMDFLTYSVQGWLNRIESAMEPLLPGAKHVRFDTSVLVRLDAVSKWEANRLRLDSAAASINEVKAEEGEQPVPWGDRPYLPGIKTAAAGQAIQWGEEPGSRAKAAQKDPAVAASSEGTG
jgi:HK97 family phage portal protein